MIMTYLVKNNNYCFFIIISSYLDITSWSHKKLIDLIRAEFPEDVLWREINTAIS